ncbi:helix-turn-helix domain-containing protein [Alkalihalophilus lindianensis]|uniref:Helix-turn-helix domain-containing protein n=1 Tax=Alkalihalophilus lindianensis TaxID=1630542 RepID=A0ABU3XBC1_9BACI|nr:helix-turn-helix domain-containing protein [Alkalihalophilus lindianensis]MDV2685176.1 helix-turn-helix domain-containing protein [Alkalihalophilus lindianensis]
MPFSYKPLWKLLLDEDMTKTQLREELEMSSTTLARMGKGQNVSMEVLDKLCKRFGVQPNEIIEYVESDK